MVHAFVKTQTEIYCVQFFQVSHCNLKSQIWKLTRHIIYKNWHLESIINDIHLSLKFEIQIKMANFTKLHNTGDQNYQK